jgi:phosphatidate cytidylyltransferase
MLRHRLQSGLLISAALLAAVFLLPPLGVLGVLLLVSLLALLEFYALLQARQIPHFKVLGTVSGLLLVGGTWWARHGGCPQAADVETLILAAAFLGVLVAQLFQREADRPWECMGGTLLGLLYVAFLFGFLVKILTVWGDAAGRSLLLYLIVVVKFTDIGAYTVGCAIGRHKLIPRISPAKTWEGVVGGVLIGVAAGFAYWRLRGGHFGDIAFSPADVLVSGVILAVAGVLGDLIESLFKRAAGVKDSGALFLGMGGILDVVDSLLLTAPILYLYLRVAPALPF